MKISIKDLIQIIGEKYNIEILDDFFTELKNSRLDEYPKEFLEEINQIIEPMKSKACNNEVLFESIKDIRKFIPEDYLNKIQPIDEDGQKVMSFSELRDAINNPNLKTTESITNINADKERAKLKASYVHNEYPVYSSLEHSWRVLESDYEVINRNAHPSNNPISSFAYYVSLGFYPPPEIMILISKAIERYFNSEGEKSLDETFFDEKHQKTKSKAYKNNKKYRYIVFDLYIRQARNKKDASKLSLEKLIEKEINEGDQITLLMHGIDPSCDIDSLLRGYRRWKKELKEGKFD